MVHKLFIVFYSIFALKKKKSNVFSSAFKMEIWTLMLTGQCMMSPEFDLYLLVSYKTPLSQTFATFTEKILTQTMKIIPSLNFL